MTSRLAARRRTVRGRLLRWAAAALAAAACFGCGLPQSRFERVVLVTLDTTRANHLGAYGYPRATSPFLDSLAARGVLFERAMAPMSETVPAHATMFTSLYPLEHGVVHNGQRLGAGATTAAEVFHRAGYSTRAFVSLGLLRRSGLQRGFEEVEYRGSMAREAGPPACDAQATTTGVIEWLREQPRERRFFIWVHYYDPHAPYAPPAAALEAVRRDSGPVAAVERLLRDDHGIGLGIYAGDSARMLDTVERYDGELRAMDDQLRRLYEAFLDLGLADGSVWLIVGDHGEGLGSHDWLEHSTRIHQEQIRVPLVLHAPGEPAWPQRRVAEVVELTDLLPTLAGFAGLPPTVDSRGRSLLARLADGPPVGSREALVQRRSFDGGPDRMRRESEPTVLRWEDGERLALVGRRWKYVHWTAGPDELYDLEADPVESRNLAAAEAETVVAMRERLLSRVRDLRSRRLVHESADEHTLELLRSLGYLQ